MTQADLIKCGVVFLNGFAGLIAAFPGPELGTLERLICAALVAGCGAVLLFLDRVGGSKAKADALDPDDMTPAQRRRLAMKLRDVMEQTPATPIRPRRTAGQIPGVSD